MQSSGKTMNFDFSEQALSMQCCMLIKLNSISATLTIGQAAETFIKEFSKQIHDLSWYLNIVYAKMTLYNVY